MVVMADNKISYVITRQKKWIDINLISSCYFTLLGMRCRWPNSGPWAWSWAGEINVWTWYVCLNKKTPRLALCCRSFFFFFCFLSFQLLVLFSDGLHLEWKNGIFAVRSVDPSDPIRIVIELEARFFFRFQRRRQYPCHRVMREAEGLHLMVAPICTGKLQRLRVMKI